MASARTIEALRSLGIHSIDQDWVKTVWAEDFTEHGFVPDEVEQALMGSNNYLEELKKLHKTLQTWTTEQQDDSEGFWSVLVESELSHKNLIAILDLIIDLGLKRISNASSRLASIEAAQVYLTLLLIPGSGAFKVFHPMLFDYCIKILKTWSQLNTTKRKRASSPVHSSQTGRKNKSRRMRGSGSQPAEAEGDDNPFANDEEEEEDEEERGSFLTPGEVYKVSGKLLKLLQTLVMFLDGYSLRHNEQSAYACLQLLTELGRLEPETFGGEYNPEILISDMKTVPELAYKGLDLLCNQSHGEIPAMINAMCRHLLPRLLLLVGDNKGAAAQTVLRPLVQCRDHALSFIKHLMRAHKEVSMPSIRVLLQHLCSKVPDKTDYRAKVAQTISVILHDLPPANYASFMEWFHKFSRSAKISYRGFALDLVNLLLAEPEHGSIDASLSSAPYLSHAFRIQMLLMRCSDIAPTVRARAIAGLAGCTTSPNAGVSEVMRELMTPAIGRRAVTRVVPTPIMQQRILAQMQQGDTEETPSDQQSENTIEAGSSIVEGVPNMTPAPEGTIPVDSAVCRTPLAEIFLNTPGADVSLADGKGVLSLLRRRASDDKVNVRKAALQALESMLKIMDAEDINILDLHAIGERCQDPALSIRKQVLHSLTELLNHAPHHAPIRKEWLDGVLPLVTDRETTAQEKCLEVLEEVLLSNIAPFHRSRDTSYITAWQLLNTVACSEHLDHRRYLQSACRHWGRQGRLKTSLVTSLQSHVGTENNAGAWMFLAELAQFVSKFDIGFVLDYWQHHAKDALADEYQTVEHVLAVISHGAKHLDADQLQQLAGDLKQRLMKFDSPPELISATTYALNKLCQADCGGEIQATQQVSQHWFGELLDACDDHLSRVILNEDQTSTIDEDLLIRHLYTLGEIAQLCPQKTPRRTHLLVQSLIAAPVISSDSISQDSSQGDSQSSQGLSQGLSQGTQVLSQFSGSKMSGRVRAAAFVTLGKLCLQNPDLAKKCVAALARELETSTEPAVRNNVLITMSDLCVRYTSLVDRYVTNIAACLSDENALIRKQTITLLTHLLQEDYLKWKGVLFFRYITTLVDEDSRISKFSEFCLVHILLQGHPTMFYQHFVECVFHFNNFSDHTVYNKFPQTEKERTKFSLQGNANQGKRMRLYRFMLEHMPDEHRFQLQTKLAQEVLAAVVDGVLALSDETADILQDTLAILSCKEIKLSTLHSRPQDEVAETEAEMAAVVMNIAKKKIISQVVKKNMVENVVPTVISLKHLLERERSVVLSDLMKFLCELMKDYKTEVKDILVADKQLAKEIEFDLRRFEERQKDIERRRLSGATLARSPQIGTPRAGSPRTPNSKGTPASPRPAAASPATPKTPQATTPGRQPGLPSSPRTPAAVLRTPRPGAMATPARASMSAFAIMNSAKKAVEQLRLTKQKAATPKPDQGTRKVAFAEDSQASPGITGSRSTSERLSQSDITSPKVQTPKNRRRPTTAPRPGRDISTPSTTMLGNLTFHQGDLSIIPMSPIHMLDTDSDAVGPWTTEVSEDEEGRRRETDVLHMFSPDKAPRGQKMWNVKLKKLPLKDTTAVAEKNAKSQSVSDSEDKNVTADSSDQESFVTLSKTDVEKENSGRKKSTRSSGRAGKSRKEGAGDNSQSQTQRKGVGEAEKMDDSIGSRTRSQNTSRSSQNTSRSSRRTRKK